MKESDIRPQDLMEKYNELSAKDSEICFSNNLRFDIPCIACGSKDLNKEFSKNGFQFATCKNCGSLFQTPRPSIEEFEKFYQDSKSSRYWAEVFFPSVAEARRKKIFKPRVEGLISICNDIDLEVNKLIDVGAGYGIFLEEWKSVKPNTELIFVQWIARDGIGLKQYSLS